MGLRPTRFMERPPTIVPEVLQRVNQYRVMEAIISNKPKETYKRPHQEPSQKSILGSSWRKKCPWKRGTNQSIVDSTRIIAKTQECHDLMEYIKELICRGHLKRFI
ncbi:hypothetical protein C4D60_Mb06t01630 [Musa balbisiana]|uniref:Uncharacterized protein n=1 Tax=Musa balbisiana TaxID=52838 RepID=A0A4S8IJU0_MUSBA|nr:hypothetical protein C4D60_Mb06t01630 [Musa balbisiana]